MKERNYDLTSRWLHIFAMTFMLMDHMWATVLSDYQWLTWVGRLAFPIFAFLTVEGYVHTSNFKKYMTRLFISAVLSEIPFNLMLSGRVFNPYHQNVIWTFIIALSLIHINEIVKKKDKLWLTLLTAVGTTGLGYVIGIITFVDYNAAGVVTVLMFYFFRGRKWWNYLIQFACLYYINAEYLQGLCFEVEIFGKTIEIVQQGLAVFSFPFIMLYKGRPGKKSKAFQYFCYWFYPVHLLVLGLLKFIL